MRVLLVTGSLPPMRCGVGDYSLGLAQALAGNAGIELAILTSEHAAPRHDPRIKVFPAMRQWKISELRRAVKVIRGFAPDLIHIQDPTQGYRGYLPFVLPLVARLLGIKVVRTWHEVPHFDHVGRYRLQSIDHGPIIHVRPGLPEILPRALQDRRNQRSWAYIPNASTLPKSTATATALQQIRDKCLKGQQRLIAFFGFIYEHKGVDLLFDIGDPARDHLVIIGQREEGSEYCARLNDRAATPEWKGKATFTGFLAENDSADLLAAADAVVLPFRTGGGIWNTSIHAAILQETFVLSTTEPASGYDAQRNIYFAAPGDIAGMKSALDRYAGRKRRYSDAVDEEWANIARQHIAVYQEALGKVAA